MCFRTSVRDLHCLWKKIDFPHFVHASIRFTNAALYSSRCCSRKLSSSRCACGESCTLYRIVRIMTLLARRSMAHSCSVCRGGCLSTPATANTPTDLGHPVNCAVVATVYESLWILQRQATASFRNSGDSVVPIQSKQVGMFPASRS